MSKGLSLFLLFFSMAVGAVELRERPQPDSVCEDALSPQHDTAPSLEARWAEVVEVLNRLGLSQLTRPLDEKLVVLNTERWRWLRLKAVKVCQIPFCKPRLLVSSLPMDTPLARQLSIWRVAEALFELQIQSGLFTSARWLSQTPRELVLDSDSLLDYFLIEMPEEYRLERLDLLTRLNDEMYKLFSNLGLLDQSVLLPSRDAGRPSSIRVLLGSDVTQRISPNREDFEIWRSQGAADLGKTLAQRHDRSLLFHYYMNHLKRLAWVTGVASTISILGPASLHPPAQHDQPQVEVQVDGDERAYRQMISSEYARISRHLTLEQKRTAPDSKLIADLQANLNQLVLANPWLRHSP